MNTMQQEFDAVVAHLYKQGRPATADGACAYRGENGAMCAVGVRIPDSAYSHKMEGKQYYDLIELFPLELPAEIYAYNELFFRLQETHDHWSFKMNDETMTWNEWLDQQLPIVAADFDLTFAAPETK